MLQLREICTSTGSFDTERGFTGQISDSGTGLNFYNARYQDPALGRFISPDSIVPNPANPAHFNRFTYVTNNPLKFTDPTGHCGQTDMESSIGWECSQYWGPHNYHIYQQHVNGIEGTVSDGVHVLLDVAGLVPFIGELADLANAGLYAVEGDLGNAGLSAASAVPFFGMAATGARLVGRSLGEIAEATRWGRPDTAGRPFRTARTRRW